MEKVLTALGIIFCIVLVGVGVFNITPYGRRVLNTYKYNVQKVDDVTNYETIKEVEDSCRAMISSYESDKLTYEQYKDSDSEEKRSWAEQAKMRANKTATSYNNYILKNSFVWSGNVPKDIREELVIIE